MPSRAPRDAAARLREMADQDSDNELAAESAAAAEETVDLIKRGNEAMAKAQQAMKRSADSMEETKKAEKKLATAMGMKLPIADNFIDPNARGEGNLIKSTDTADDVDEYVQEQINHLQSLKAKTKEEHEKLKEIVDGLIADRNAMKRNAQLHRGKFQSDPLYYEIIEAGPCECPDKCGNYDCRVMEADEKKSRASSAETADLPVPSAMSNKQLEENRNNIQRLTSSCHRHKTFINGDVLRRRHHLGTDDDLDRDDCYCDDRQ